MAAGRVVGRIVVVHDDAAFAAPLAASLQRFGHEAMAAPSTSLGRGVQEAFSADVVVIALDDGAGEVERLGALLARSDVPFVVVTSSSNVDDRLAAFGAGADDVVVRPIAVRELDARLQVVLRRRLRRRTVHQIGSVILDESAHTVTVAGTEVPLTALEFSVLLTLLRHRGQVLSKLQLLKAVWGPDRDDVNLVEAQVSGLRRKLERLGPRIVHTVRGAGYIVRAPDGRPPDAYLEAV